MTPAARVRPRTDHAWMFSTVSNSVANISLENFNVSAVFYLTQPHHSTTLPQSTQTHATTRLRPQTPSPALQPDGCHTDTLLRLDCTDFPIILSLMRSLATQRTIKLSQSGFFSTTPPSPPPPPSSQFVYTTSCPIRSLFADSMSASSFVFPHHALLLWN